MKKISVITPSFNSEKYIARAIESVLDQNYDNFEHIIIDGLSTDSTVEILKQYKHVKWISEPDNGQSDAMNKGFSISSGEIIVYLNVDDYFMPNIFETVNRSFQKEVDIVFGNVEIHTKNKDKSICSPSTNYIDILEHWKVLYPINPVQYFYKRELQIGIEFNVDNHLAMDHEFLLSICKDRKIEKIEKVFGVFDMVYGSKTLEGTSDPETYWTTDNFKYIDDFLKEYPVEYILNFKNKQIDLFMKNMGVYKHYLNNLKIEQKKLTRNKRLSIEEVELLLDFLKDYDKIIIYGAGEQTENLFYALRGKINYIVDLNFIKINTINDKSVFHPDMLLNESEPLVLVLPVGYKIEIQQTIKKYNDNANIIFLEDFFND